MKIHVEFNSLAEVAAFAKFTEAGLVPPPKGNIAKDQEKEDGYKWKYERTVENLERALKRISMLDPKGETANYDFMPEAPLKGTDVYDLELSARAMNCLKAAGIKTIEELCTKTRLELRKQPNLGHGTLRDIVSALYKRNLKLKGD